MNNDQMGNFLKSLGIKVSSTGADEHGREYLVSKFHNNEIQFLLSDKSEQIAAEIAQYCQTHPTAHILITGYAASGKTYLLMRILANLSKLNAGHTDYDFAPEDSRVDMALFDQLYSGSTAPDYFHCSTFESTINQRKILIIHSLEFCDRDQQPGVSTMIASSDLCLATLSAEYDPLGNNNWPPLDLFDLVIDVSSRTQLDQLDVIVPPRDLKPLFRKLIKESAHYSMASIVETLNDTIQRYDDSGKLLLYDRSITIPKPEIILPSKEIITGISVIESSLLKRVQSDPEQVHKLSPREFEEFVAEAYESLGYKVELTKMTRDGGKDIILYADGPTGHNMYYVECKKYRKDRPVDVSLVRNLYGVVEAERATAGILVTSSSFTSDARSFERQLYHRMRLLDYLDLLAEVAKRQ